MLFFELTLAQRFPVFIKLGQKIGSNDISAEFENGSSPLKNMAARGRGSFPYMALVKPW